MFERTGRAALIAYYSGPDTGNKNKIIEGMGVSGIKKLQA